MNVSEVLKSLVTFQGTVAHRDKGGCGSINTGAITKGYAEVGAVLLEEVEKEEWNVAQLDIVVLAKTGSRPLWQLAVNMETASSRLSRC